MGAERYHHRHPFNLRMHEGALGDDEIRLWVANRYYYQTRIPIKDGLILAKSADPAFRRDWIQRIHDHDGTREREGGLELWLALADAVGLDRARVEAFETVLPGVRRACDAYVAFVEESDLFASVAASLTELIAGDIMAVRIAAFEEHYPWVETGGLRYFRTRTSQAPADADYGLALVKREARTLADQERAVAALERKCAILWSLLDAVDTAGARPVLSPHAVVRDEGDGGELLVVLPERAVAVGGSGREILALVDGSRTCLEIAAAQAARHPKAPSAIDDAHDFISRMLDARAFALERS